MAERTVKSLQFWYHVKVKDEFQAGDVITERIARKDETVDFQFDSDVARGDKNGDFYTEAELARMAGNVPPEETVDELDLETASVDEVAEWIEDQHPTVDDVLQIVHDNPELAQKMLDAENMAHSGDPRKGVAEGIAKVLERQSA